MARTIHLFVIMMSAVPVNVRSRRASYSVGFNGAAFFYQPRYRGSSRVALRRPLWLHDLIYEFGKLWVFASGSQSLESSHLFT
jgi:hypothetical protein